ncbi:ParB/RepB/Spo0J family partition protein [Rhodobacterales bacterium LSUCC0387]|nr:ParB/RepB/Spo0J family partition protein [Rhodobacterales bacterium LSUCC0387]
MMSKRDKRGLGRGLSALMQDIDMGMSPAPNAVPAQDVEGSQPAPVRRADTKLPIERIRPNSEQPRRNFTSEALEELAASIKEKGIIQPLIVRADPNHDGDYQIVAGERRWRASQMAQLHELPVIIRDFTDVEVLEIAIIENIQRADLNAIEEAMGYRQLIDRFGHTQEKLAGAMGKSRSHIANLMRLLQLPDDVQVMLREGRLSAGHARALITTPNASELAREIIAKGLSVREAEKLASAAGDKPKSARPTAPTKDADTRAIEADLSAALGMKVDICHDSGSGAGKISISYKDLEALDELMRRLGGGA